MAEKILEFRGITLPCLCQYFEGLGMQKRSDTFPIVYSSSCWTAEIISEKEITFTANFRVNAVHIRFMAETEAELQQLIKNYRFKTTRVGG